MVKFSHIADCHLGAFGRNPTLREYNLQAFERVIEKSIQEEVDFIIIAGDLFHNPHPDMDVVDRAVKSLVKARK
ncbi:MAG: metallophosphoesterase, partial [Candidatus Saliniplasma sp.]